MTVMNIIAIVTFIIGVPGIGWMIWNKEKVIRFEQRILARVLDAFEAAALLLQHERQMMYKGKEVHQ